MVFLKSYHHPYLFMMIENRSRHTENLEKVDSCINAKVKITSNLKKVKFHPIWFWRPLLNYSITIMFILEVQVNKTIKFLTISSLNITFHVILLFCSSLGFERQKMTKKEFYQLVRLIWMFLTVNTIHITFCIMPRFRDLCHPLHLEQILAMYYDPRKMRGFCGMAFRDEHSEIQSKMVCTLGHVV